MSGRRRVGRPATRVRASPRPAANQPRDRRPIHCARRARAPRRRAAAAARPKRKAETRVRRPARHNGRATDERVRHIARGGRRRAHRPDAHLGHAARPRGRREARARAPYGTREEQEERAPPTARQSETGSRGARPAAAARYGGADPQVHQRAAHRHSKDAFFPTMEAPVSTDENPELPTAAAGAPGQIRSSGQSRTGPNGSKNKRWFWRRAVGSPAPIPLLLTLAARVMFFAVCARVHCPIHLHF